MQASTIVNWAALLRRWPQGALRSDDVWPAYKNDHNRPYLPVPWSGGLGRSCCGAAIVGLGLSADGSASEAPAPAAPKAAEPPKPCKATLSFPAYGGIIKQNPDPGCFTLPGLGDIYLGFALTGYAYEQRHPFPFPTIPLPTDRTGRVDFTNAQIFVQKPDGPFQFYVQAGAYAIPALGVVNFGTFDQTDLLFGPVPVAFGKIVFNDTWSIQGGRMPTLIGTEAPFTFQNLNISRGLLFNQENVINHGVQLNYANGPWSVSVAGTDGFFSGDISWFTGAVTYKVDDFELVWR